MTEMTELKSIPVSECRQIQKGSCDGCPVYEAAILASRQWRSIEDIKNNCPPGGKMQPMPYSVWAARLGRRTW